MWSSPRRRPAPEGHIARGLTLHIKSDSACAWNIYDSPYWLITLISNCSRSASTLSYSWPLAFWHQFRGPQTWRAQEHVWSRLSSGSSPTATANWWPCAAACRVEGDRVWGVCSGEGGVRLSNYLWCIQIGDYEDLCRDATKSAAFIWGQGSRYFFFAVSAWTSWRWKLQVVLGNRAITSEYGREVFLYGAFHQADVIAGDTMRVSESWNKIRRKGLKPL